MSSPLVLVEKLISAVARAFYTDSYIVVFDALLSEKFIIEEELPPRLKMSVKEVTKITRQLEDEMLIRSENVKVDDGSLIKYLYIDYQLFFYAVLYRIDLMQKWLKVDEKTELNESFYKCPTCSAKYTELEVLRQISGDNKFICVACCPHDRYQQYASEHYFTLEMVDNEGQIGRVQLQRSKMDDQLKRSRYHEGIIELLIQLRDVNLGHNLPSENMKKGMRSSIIYDEDVLSNVQHSLEHANGSFGGSRVKVGASKSLSAIINKQHNNAMTDLKINIEVSNFADEYGGSSSLAADGDLFETEIRGPQLKRSRPNEYSSGKISSAISDVVSAGNAVSAGGSSEVTAATPTNIVAGKSCPDDEVEEEGDSHWVDEQNYDDDNDDDAAATQWNDDDDDAS